MKIQKNYDLTHKDSHRTIAHAQVWSVYECVCVCMQTEQRSIGEDDRVRPR